MVTGSDLPHPNERKHADHTVLMMELAAFRDLKQELLLLAGMKLMGDLPSVDRASFTRGQNMVCVAGMFLYGNKPSTLR